MMRLAFTLRLTAGLLLLAAPAVLGQARPPAVEDLSRDAAALEARISALRSRSGGAPALLADAEAFLKGARWGLRYGEPLAEADLTLIRRGLDQASERTAALESGSAPWTRKRGKMVRGYVSAVDGSVQPYGLIVPKSYTPGKPMRLDVVLHGSTKPTGMSELRFIMPFAGPDDRDDATDPKQDWIELRPLGRVENCYRWAGETDVFEAIEDVCRSYAIDRDRIVLRGMSMGASGTWHLGLKHPDRFAALGPYCGYVDTYQFSLSPMPNFVPVRRLPRQQALGLHMLDSVDYAANAGIVPVVGAIGENDPFFQAHVLMGKAFAREGLPFVNLISPGTGHVQDPVTFAEQMRRIGEHAARGVDHRPKHLRFVTWTLKYPRAHWLEALSLGEHYQRSELNGRIEEDGAIRLVEPVNVTRFAVHPPALTTTSRLSIGGQAVKLPRQDQGKAEAVVLAKRDGRWTCEGRLARLQLTRAAQPSTLNPQPSTPKRPGLQGPIDDAFTAPFLCVRGTGTPWSRQVGDWVEMSRKRFAEEWSRYFRGDVRAKDDTQVTEDDLKRYHLILFGDPGSNTLIRKALPRLPLRWNRDKLELNGRSYESATHAPILIQPNPLPGGEGHYVVLNSGHTFHEQELASLNYLLFPRLGDWAVMRVGPRYDDEPADTGFFDERWAFGQVESKSSK